MWLLQAFPVVPVLIAAAIGLNLRSRRLVRRGAGPAEGSAYAALVRVGVRDARRGGPFTSLKNGFGSVALTIDADPPHTIRVSAIGGGLSGIAKALGGDYAFKPSEVEMRIADVGWGGTSLASRDRIVLSGVSYGRRELALVAVDGDLGQLQAALAAAGVKGGGEVSSGRPVSERSSRIWLVVLSAAILLVLILTVGNHAAMLVFVIAIFGLAIRELVKGRRGRG